MSVINKMLRDLDSREAVQVPAVAQPSSQQMRATTSLPVLSVPASREPTKQNGWWMILAVLLVVIAGVTAWWRSHTPPAAPPVAAAVLVPPSSLSQAAGPAHSEPPAAPAAQQLNKAAAQLATPPKARPTSRLPLISAPATAQAIAATTLTAGAVQATANSTAGEPVATVTASAASHASNSATTESSNSGARQTQAGREALAQAQSLWAAGSHDAATELMQQALALAERSTGAGQPSATLIALARELGRMQLADGRAGATLELFTRLEPQLTREADIWAMRGNAAQRLGRHQDSLRAYAAALQLRPGEQRWMLGSAVSLAALGQTANATEMAEKARALGPISKEVLAYLRQAGVQLSEP